MTDRPAMAVVSHVLPFPATAGQHLRVRYFLEAVRPHFETVFVGVAPAQDLEASRATLADLVDDVRLLPARVGRGAAASAGLAVAGSAYALAKGVKRSNFDVGVVELSPHRVAAALAGRRVELAAFHYWHASAAAAEFRRRGVTTVLDMHNVLAWSRRAQLEGTRFPARIREWTSGRYERAEERAWGHFDALVAINGREARHAQARVPGPVFRCGMGVDLRAWPHRWRRPERARVAYYGGLGGLRGRAEVLSMAETVMPAVWRVDPAAELVVVGANPSPEIVGMAADPRIDVTGFVPDPGEVLARCSIAVVPFRGRYGFRSRIVELMATGVPVVCTSDAIDGMDLGAPEGIDTAPDLESLAEAVVSALGDPALADRSAVARRVAVDSFSVEATYGEFASQLASWYRSGRG